MTDSNRLLLSGNEAVARACLDSRVDLGVGYPGTPSTEILETFSKIGGTAQWSPNEKVALEVGIGVAFGRAKAIVTMKHVGVNVAADPLFTVAYAGVSGALVLVSADDPGMHSSQNEQDNRNYAKAAGVPMLEPASSQEAYDFTRKAFEISARWNIPVILRMTTRVCHSQTVVQTAPPAQEGSDIHFERDIKGRVMIPAYARPAHKRLRQKLAEITAWNEAGDLNPRVDGDSSVGIVSSGVSYVHAREAAPEASHLKIGMSYPIPMDTIRAFAESVDRCVVVEEGDPWLTENIRAAGIQVDAKPHELRFGELNVARVKHILDNDCPTPPPPPPGKPPRLCPGCSHRSVFATLSRLECIVTGDIGCYTLGVLPPYEAMDTCVCMGASIGVGLGLRHVLPREEAKRVVSVIGDSTFMHSGVTGLIDMVYNPPETGHVVLIVDNSTTAMTGLQEHPGTGRKLDHSPATRVSFEDLARSLGIENVHVMNPSEDMAGFQRVLKESLDSEELVLIIARRPCILAAKRLKAFENAAVQSNG